MGKSEAWIWWRNKGYSPKAVAAILGNIQAESAFISNNVEDRCPLSDNDYTAQVDNGKIPKKQFCMDAYGYGYYQHTYWSRKQGLFELCKKRGKSIADENCQHEWAEQELHQGEFLRVYNKLMSDTSLADMTREFMCFFEKPANQSEAAISYRIGLAQAIYDEFVGNEPAGDKPKPEIYWPPRMIDKNMAGPDVFALQGILCARGYFKSAMNGRFDDTLEVAVKAFQRDHGLVVDGVVGPKTWKILLGVET